MKKLCGIIVFICILALSGCGHTHTWVDADCTTPKTCSSCGEIDGESLGHTWVDADCTNPKTCTACGLTEGAPLGHIWVDADCTNPKTCTACKLTEGAPLGHTWVDADCTAPETCTVCGKTRGEPLGHNTPNLTCTNDDTCSRCGEAVAAPGHVLSEATCTEPAKCSVCGETVGDALGHTTASGTCKRCGMEIYDTVSGYGDDVISDITTGDGIYRVHFTHSGSRNFIVKAYDSYDDRELLINEIGRYNGYVLLLGKAPFSFEITAGGSWEYTIERLSRIPDTEFLGKGDYVTGISSLTSGAWEFTHDGNHNFIVKIYTTDGADLLVNEN